MNKLLKKLRSVYSISKALKMSENEKIKFSKSGIDYGKVILLRLSLTLWFIIATISIIAFFVSYSIFNETQGYISLPWFIAINIYCMLGIFLMMIAPFLVLRSPKKYYIISIIIIVITSLQFFLFQRLAESWGLEKTLLLFWSLN